MATTWKAPTWRMPNEKNQSKFESYGLTFDGSSNSIDLGNNIVLGTNKYSFSFWLKTSSTTTQSVIGTRNDNTDGWVIQIAQNSILFYNVKSPSNRITSDKDITDGNWHHVVVVRGGTTSTNKIYVDGTSQNLTYNNENLTNPASTLSMKIGVQYHSSQFERYFNGEIGSVLIFDYELDSNQIASLYNSGSPINPMTLKPAPIAYYPLGGNASTGGDSTNTLSVPNIAVPDASVFDFDYSNSDAITLGNTIGNGFTQITCSIWVKLSTTELANNSRYRNFLVKFNGTALGPFELRGNYARGDSGNNKLFFRVATDTGSYGFTDTGFAFTEANRWYHIVGTYDGSNVKTFVDGIEKSTISANGTLVSNSDNATIGFDTGTGGFDGEMSNAQIWNTALSSTEIQTLYNNGQPLMTGTQPQEANLKAWYKLNQSANWEADTAGNWQIPDAVSSYPQSFNFSSSNIECNKLNISTAITISAWVKTTTTSNTRILVNEDDWGSNRNWHLYIAGSNKVLFRAYDSGGNAIAYIRRIGAGEVTDGKWHNIVVTWDGTTSANAIKLAIDNDIETDTATGTGINTSNAPLSIGSASNSASTNSFTGVISNVQVWDNAVSNSQITELYNNGVPLTTAIATDNLKAWYKLNDNEKFDGTNWSVENQKYPAGFDSCLDFNGTSSSVNVPAFSDYDNGDLSACIWVNTSDTRTNTDYVFSNSGSSTKAGFDIAINRYGSVKTMRKTRTLTADTGFNVVGLTENTWHHIAFTYEESTNTIKQYFDGQLTETVIGGTRTKAASLQLTIGSYQDTGSFFLGKLSNAAIYNTVLDPATITAIYNNGTPETSISGSPVAWWKLDNLTTGIQDSVGSRNGTNSGATKVNTFVSTEAATSSGMTEQNLVNNNVSALNGESSGMDTSNLVTSTLTRQVPYNSYSLNFDSGNPDYIDCGTGLGDSLGTYTGDLTLSYWFNTDSLTANRGLFYIGSFSNAQGEFQVNIYANSMRFRVDGGTQTKLLDISGLSTGTWYHIAFVYKAGNISDSKVYLNGVDQSTTDTGTFPSSLSFSGLKTIIGGYYGTGNTFDGKMNNLSLFNETLTSTEVMKLYNSGVPGDLSNFNPTPVSWWSLGSDSYYNGANYICPDLIGTNNGTSSGMDANALIGDAPNSTANGTSTNMAIDANLTGSAPNSSNNSFSVNMDYSDRETSVPS